MAQRRTLLVAAFAAVWVLGIAVPRPSYAVDGVIEINQATALAGGVTGSLADDPAGFPVVITQSGRYRLTGNLSVPAGADGIVVSPGTQNVDIDLNGFVISGMPGSLTGLSLGNGSYSRVHNGTITQMGGYGIFAVNKGALIEHVQVRNCGQSGINVAEGTVRRCEVGFNVGVGIAAQVIEGSRVQSNGLGGISVVGPGRATGNQVAGNGGAGIRSSTAVVEGNVVTGTTGAFGAGIEVLGSAASCAIIANAIVGNVGAGILFNGADATRTGIANNVIQGNASAYSGGTPTLMSGNAVQSP